MDQKLRFVKFLLLGAVLSGIMIVLNLRASATDLS